MPAKGFKKSEPNEIRLKVGLSIRMATALSAKAAQVPMTQAAYVRALIAKDIGDSASKPKSKRQHDSMLLQGDVHQLAMQVRKLGVNFNQMARQVNTGLVPLTPQEMAAMSAQFVVTMDKVHALFQKLLDE